MLEAGDLAREMGKKDGGGLVEKALTKQTALLFVAKNVSLYILSCRIMWSESRKSF